MFLVHWLCLHDVYVFKIIFFCQKQPFKLSTLTQNLFHYHASVTLVMFVKCEEVNSQTLKRVFFCVGKF